MRRRWKNRDKDGPGSRSQRTTENQLAFNVICLAVSVGSDAHTEECQSEFND